MKNIQKITIGLFCTIMIIFSCKKDRPSLNNLPKAAFDIEFVDSNNVKFISKSTENPFLFNWTVVNLGDFKGNGVIASIPNKGIYQVILTVYSQGGSDTLSKFFEITKNEKPACTPEMEFLTNCSSRTWTLAKKPGSLWVGPANASTTWWAIDAAGVVTRSCAFNDEWTFNADGTVDYDCKGDLWGEAATGFKPDGCYPESDLTADTKFWGSGKHQFMLTGGTGTDPLILKMIGKGAFIGLQKVANGKEVSTPQMGVDYKVVSQTKTATDRFTEVEVNFGAGIWRFTLTSPE